MHYPSDAGITWECRKVEAGQTLESMFGDRWVDVARFNRMDRRHVHPGIGIRVPKNLEQISCFTPMPARFEAGVADAKLVLVDLSEQFLGAYERGRLVFSAPIASGRKSNPTPSGAFEVTATHQDHRSSLYCIEGTSRPYPMHFGLLFHTTPSGVAYWIHGRDLPGYPASHGCIGMSDEAMQNECYGVPKDPQLADARALYDWVRGDAADTGEKQAIEGPRVQIVGTAPIPGAAAVPRAREPRAR